MKAKGICMGVLGLFVSIAFSILLSNVGVCQNSIHPLIRKLIAYHEAQERGDPEAGKDLFSEDSRI
ncbi:MAG TPA: hypothetical protein VID27_09315 [Blastocatellia bacterium]